MPIFERKKWKKNFRLCKCILDLYRKVAGGLVAIELHRRGARGVFRVEDNGSVAPGLRGVDHLARLDV